MSAYATPSRRIFRARKPHTCDWCGEPIAIWSSYRTWCWFEGGEACTVRAHLECWEESMDEFSEYGETRFDRSNQRPEPCAQEVK